MLCARVFWIVIVVDFVWKLNMFMCGVVVLFGWLIRFFECNVLIFDFFFDFGFFRFLIFDFFVILVLIWLIVVRFYDATGDTYVTMDLVSVSHTYINVQHTALTTRSTGRQTRQIQNSSTSWTAHSKETRHQRKSCHCRNRVELCWQNRTFVEWWWAIDDRCDDVFLLCFVFTTFFFFKHICFVAFVYTVRLKWDISSTYVFGYRVKSDSDESVSLEAVSIVFRFFDVSLYD